MADTGTEPLAGRPAIFGEVLYDCFPGDRTVLGGAPFNVAWHLQGFGLNPLFISRIGDDPLGDKVAATMADWGMDLGGLQRDPDHPTGQVRIEMRGTAHTFDILPAQAYDRIDPEAALAATAGQPLALLYHGSLIAREARSAAALKRLREALALPVFVDINLRAPWWEREAVQGLMSGARWLKLNDEELEALAPGDGGLEVHAAGLRRQLGLELLVVTRGEHGALLLSMDGSLTGEPEPVTELVDTVGAGDAFAAVTLLGLIEGWPRAATLQRALAFAAAICRNRGATLADRGYYRELLRQWRK